MKPKGWVKEPRRHALASKGIKTAMPKEEIMIKTPISNRKGLSREEYQEIGVKRGLEGADLANYIEFMKERFPKEFDEGYATEWAGRFRKGTEFVNADGESRSKLIKVDRERYAPVATYGGFVFKEGHDVIYEDTPSQKRFSGRVVENRGDTIMVLTQGTVKELPAKKLDLSGYQTKRD